MGEGVLLIITPGFPQASQGRGSLSLGVWFEEGLGLGALFIDILFL